MKTSSVWCGMRPAHSTGIQGMATARGEAPGRARPGAPDRAGAAIADRLADEKERKGPLGRGPRAHHAALLRHRDHWTTNVASAGVHELRVDGSRREAEPRPRPTD